MIAPLPPELAAPPAFDVELIDADGVPEIVQRWRIDGTGSAAWAMAHVAKAEAALSELEAQAVEWYGNIDAWLAHEAAPHRRTKEFFEAHLERYALDLREADPARKSVTLPGGVVRTTAKAAAVKVTDEKAVLLWADEHLPGAIARDPRLRLTILRDVVQPVQLVTAARFTHSCGDVVTVDDPVFSEQGLTWPEIGSEVECPECREPVLLGKVDVLATRWVLSVPVPGVDVEPPTVTAQVVVG